MATSKHSAVNLGTLQSEAEAANKFMKLKWKALEKAKDEYAASEANYYSTQKALVAGVEAVKASTKINL